MAEFPNSKKLKNLEDLKDHSTIDLLEKAASALDQNLKQAYCDLPLDHKEHKSYVNKR